MQAGAPWRKPGTGFCKAIEADPANADAQNDLGIVLRRQKQLPEALVAFEAARRLRPGEACIHSNLALVLQDMGRIAEALAVMKEAYSLQPENITLRRNLGILHWRLGEEFQFKGELKEALVQFRKAADLAAIAIPTSPTNCWAAHSLPREILMAPSPSSAAPSS